MHDARTKLRIHQIEFVVERELGKLELCKDYGSCVPRTSVSNGGGDPVQPITVGAITMIGTGLTPGSRESLDALSCLDA